MTYNVRNDQSTVFFKGHSLTLQSSKRLAYRIPFSVGEGWYCRTLSRAAHALILTNLVAGSSPDI